MMEIKTPPIMGVDQQGNPLVTFTAAHTIADVCRWIISEVGADDAIYLMQTILHEEASHDTN